MSQENVEVVRTVLDMFTRRDHEAVFEFYDREIEWDASRPGGCNGVDTAGIYHGHDGVRTYWRRWFSAWESIQLGGVQIVDEGETIIVLIDGQRARGRGSGIPLKAPPFAIGFTLRNRKIVRWVFYPNQAEALEAVGSPE